MVKPMKVTGKVCKPEELGNVKVREGEDILVGAAILLVGALIVGLGAIAFFFPTTVVLVIVVPLVFVVLAKLLGRIAIRYGMFGVKKHGEYGK